MSVALPDGYAAFVHPRSGLAARCGVALVNAPGTVDAGYRGEIKVIVVNLDPRESVRFERFDRIAQLVVQQVEKVRFHEVAELPGSARAEGASGPPAAMPRWDGSHNGWESIRFGRIRPGRTVTCSDVARRAVPPRTRRRGRAGRRRGRQRSGQDAGVSRAGRTCRPPPGPTGPGTAPRWAQPGEGRVDLGGLFVPGVEGMELRVEVAGDAIVAATVVLRDSAIQLQGFAAPKKEGIWGEVREEIASGITQQGGIIDEVEGPLGWELRAQVPVQLPDGTNGVQVVRFVGVDGPRWFLRGVISGQGAVQPEAAGLLEQIFRDTVVVRGEGPMAPRDPIVLKLPGRRADGARGRAAGGARRAHASPAAWASSSADRRSPRCAEAPVGNTALIRRATTARAGGRNSRTRSTGHWP